MKKLSIYIIKFGAIVFALFVPYSISAISISISLVFLGYLLFCISEKKLVLPYNVDLKQILIAMILFLCVMIISTLFSYDLSSSVKRTITVTGYFILFLAVLLLEDKKFVKSLLFIFIISCSIHSLYAIIQYFTGIDIMHKGYKRFERVYGIVGHFNSLAGILGLIFPVVFSFSYFLKQKRPLNIVVTLLIFFATILTFTRGIWLGVFFSLFFIGLLTDKKILLFLLLFISVVFIVPKAKQRILNTVKFTQSEYVRKEFLVLTPKLVLRRPLFGFGPDSFRSIFYNNYPNFIEKGHFHPHNMYLHILFETGIVGLMFFLYLLYLLIKTSLKSYFLTDTSFERILLLGNFGSLVVFLVYGFVDQPFRAHFAPYVLFFLLAVSYRLGMLEQK